MDHCYLVEGFDPESPRTRFVQRRVGAGGMTATALRQAAALGCDTELLSVLGDDADGRAVRRELRAEGVGTSGLVLSRRFETTVAVVLVDRRSGERRFVVPDRRRLEARAPRLDLSAIDSRTLLLVDGHFPAQALRAVRRARELGARVIGDFHRPDPGVLRLLPHVDHLIVPLEFAQLLGEPEPRRALRALARLCSGRPVLTLGPRGGLYLEGSRVRRFRAHPARVVDTTGAGDVFHGAFAAGLAHGLAYEASLDLAARAAALACTALGGAGRLMTRGELRCARPSTRGRASRGR
jgi:sugar/nucleoside kinase (ribokinase family)